MSGLIQKPTQTQRVLSILERAGGNWVNAGAIMRETWITQLAARIVELKRAGYEIESSDFRDARHFISYRLLPKGQRIL